MHWSVYKWYWYGRGWLHGRSEGWVCSLGVFSNCARDGLTGRTPRSVYFPVRTGSALFTYSDPRSASLWSYQRTRWLAAEYLLHKITYRYIVSRKKKKYAAATCQDSSVQYYIFWSFIGRHRNIETVGVIWQHTGWLDSGNKKQETLWASPVYSLLLPACFSFLLVSYEDAYLFSIEIFFYNFY